MRVTADSQYRDKSVKVVKRAHSKDNKENKDRLRALG